ncbi:MAG: trypsin-like peptidase domain-containing protein [Dehalococcoidia bacterium]
MTRRRRPPVWAASVFAAIIVAVAVACSSGSDGGPASPSAASEPDAAQAPVAVSAATTPPRSGQAAPTAAGVIAAPVSDIATPQPPSGDAQAAVPEPDADALVAAFERVLAEVYDGALPSVVAIDAFTEGATGFGLDGTSPHSSGSGFVWDEDGRIVTNHHVIAGATRVTVEFADGNRYDAEVIGSDADTDLAVLELTSGSREPRPISLGDSSAVDVGQLAIAIGNPFGEMFTMTQGIVSAVGRTIRSEDTGYSTPDVIQTDAPINPGNSCGPLLDRQGRVIGINTQIKTRSGSSAGVGFAVPINIARRVVPELIEHGKYVHAWLGVSGGDLSPESAELMGLPRNTRGALIDTVVDGGPADDAGLRGSDRTRRVNGITILYGGDVIFRIDAATIRGMNDLISYLTNNTGPGDEVDVHVFRDGDEQVRLTVTLGERPAR